MSESDTSAEILSAALRYAAAGIAVFPTRLGVRGDGKKDVRPIASWKDSSTTDPEVIRSWFGQGGAWEGAALCIDCGKSGIVGVDQDVAEGKNGIVEWEMLSPTPTWRVKSPTGGAHDYYRADPSSPVSVDNTGTVAPGVDIRGDGGFLFAPPTIDPRGGSWEWVAGEPDWSALPDVPRIVIERMAGKASAAKKAKPATGPVAPVEFSEPDALAFGMGGMAALFAGDARANMPDFGPGGGRKTKADALALLSREHQAFTALTDEGSERSHILSQRFGVLAGRGVGVFWNYEWALNALMSACRENGFAAANGEAYARGQAERGLEYGMREPWIAIPEAVTAEAMLASPAPLDAVEALLAEMLSLDELENAPPPKYMIHEFLQYDSESWLIGAPGSKKSFVAFDMAARVVRGEPWQGFDTSPADVVFIVAEGSSGHGKRVKAWRRRYGAVEAGGRQAVFTLPRPVQAKESEKWAVLVGACRKLGQRAAEAGRGLLVIIDTQARVTVGLKENDNGEMNYYVEAVSAIRRATGACVLTIHHTKKGGGDARGASVIDGAQTTELKVESMNGKLTAKLITEKQKDIDERAPLNLAFEVVHVGQDEKGKPVTSLVLCEQDSTAFRQAWAGGEVTEEDLALEEQAKIHPLTSRATVDHWIRERTKSIPTQWLVQILHDSGRERGFTKAEVKGMVEEKIGKEVKRTTFNDAWTLITDSAGPWADVVVQGSTSDRFTADLMAVEAAENRDK